MPTKIWVTRTQWAVGTGFFHSGELSTRGSRLTYVYDCGALGRRLNQTALTREIAAFAERADCVQIVFLSHFDFDHVSGLPELARAVTIERFVIPMISASERLFAWARHVATASTDEPDYSADFYTELIIDPSQTLADFTQNGATGDTVVEVVPSEGEPDSEGDRSSPIDDSAFTGVSQAEMRGASTAAEMALEDMSSGVRVLADSTERVWEWKYDVCPEADLALPHFLTILRTQGLIPHQTSPVSPAQIRTLVVNHRDKVARAYLGAIKAVGSSYNRNMTSLMLYAGPPLGAREGAFRTRETYGARAEIGAWGPRPGWLGLGDANLRARSRVDHVNAVFAPYKRYVGTFAPSHHGSLPDWDRRLLDGFGRGTAEVPVCVFGSSGEYRSRRGRSVLHPDGEVVLDINEAGGFVVVVGLKETSRWTESLCVYIVPSSCGA